MPRDKPDQRFSEKERGTYSRLGNEDDADEAAAVAEMDAFRAEQLAKDDWDLGQSSNVRFMIASAESLLDSDPFRSDSPRFRRAAANKLLRIYQKLLDLAKQAPRDADGALQCDRFGKVGPAEALDKLVPWTDDKPHSVDEILRKDSSSGPRLPLFSRENLLAWTDAANMPELPPPAQEPRRRRMRRRKIRPTQQHMPTMSGWTSGTYHPPGEITDEDINKAMGIEPHPPPPEEIPVDVWLIKTPGMSFLSEEGQVLIYSAALRVLLRQRISDERAAEIVRAIRDIDDRIPSERKDRFEQEDCGSFLRMSLHPSFFEKLSGFEEFKDFDPKTFKQETDRRINNLITEMFSDFSPNERFFFATKLMVDRARMGNLKGYSLVLGKTYPPHGWVFIGFLNRESGIMSPWPAWLTPDCRIFIVNERESMLEGFRQGVLASAGGVLLGYAMIAIGGAALAAPEAIAAVGEISSTVGAAAGRLAAPVLQGAKEFLVVNARGAYIWLGQNWAPVMVGSVPIANIIARIDAAGLEGFFKSLYEGDWEDIVYNWATLFGDVGQVLQARGQMRGAPPSVPPLGDDEPPPKPLGPANVNVPPEDVAQPTQRPTPQTLPVQPTQRPTTTLTPPDQTRTQRPSPQVLTDQPESDLPPILIAKPSNDNAPKPAYQPNAMVPSSSQGKPLDPGEDYFRMTKPSIDPLPVGETDRPVIDIQSRRAAPQLTQIEAEPQVEPVIIVGDRMVVVGEAAQGAQGVVAARQTGTGGSNRAIQGKAATSPNRSTLGNRITGGSSRGTPPPAAAAPTVKLNPGIAKKFGLKGNEAEWIEKSADLYGEEMDKRRSIDPKTASNQAHVATQDRLRDEDYKSQLVFEEPTGFSGPKTSRSVADIRKSDVQINRVTKSTTSLRANIAAVIDFKRTAFIKRGTLVTDLRDKNAQVETDQIQAYENLYRELGVPVFITNARRQIFAPDPDASAGWILVGGPDK